jgi:hypothetical protein
VIDASKVDARFWIHRVGYGRTIDNKFVINWNKTKGKFNRAAYFFMDYYSNWYKIPGSAFVSSARGLTDAAWGKEQAETCWNALKHDPESIVWCDVESGHPSYSPSLADPEAKSHAVNILRAFMKRIDELNGKSNGIYTSVGWLNWFPSEFRSRTLWVAWYPWRSANVDVDDLLDMCKRQGWLVKPVIWQYASDGDVDDNGTGDGKTYFFSGMKEMDLNGWVGTNMQFTQMFGVPVITHEDETPVTTDPAVIPTETTKYKTTVNLAIRAMPSVNSTLLGRYYSGSQVIVLKASEPGPGSLQGWVQIAGQGVYVSLDYLKKI